MFQLSTQASLKGDCQAVKPKLLLFDLSVYGHHASYIQHLLNHISQEELTLNIDIVVSSQFLDKHADVVGLADQFPHIKFIPISSKEEQALPSRKSAANRLRRVWQEWTLLYKYATQLQADHCLIMYFDTCEVPLTARRKLPCPFSGIYFRPTLHYYEFADYKPTFKERIQQWRERLLLPHIVNHPQLQTLFCLDPLAIPTLTQFCRCSRAVYLPDPVESISVSTEETVNLKARLGIDPHKKVFLLFGALTKRKGIYQVLEALRFLSSSLSQQLCILMVGQVDKGVKAKVDTIITDLNREKPLQIIQHYQFVPETEVAMYFQLADAVLATYQRHVGMSGILLLAAAAQKPVLGDSYGLMGEITRRYQLGLTVDATQPEAIAEGLTQMLTQPEQFGNRQKMKQFVAQNSPKSFAQTILQHI